MERRQLNRGTYLRIQLPNPEIEPTHMQAILTLVVKQAILTLVVKQALANLHRISRAFSLQAIWCYVTTNLHLGADCRQLTAQQHGGR